MNDNINLTNGVNVSSFLPASAWCVFARQYFRALGICLRAYKIEGESGVELYSRSHPCSGTDKSDLRCRAFYNKAVSQLVKSEEATLFRCHGGFLHFGLALGNNGNNPKIAIVGGPVEPNSSPSKVSANALEDAVVKLPPKCRRGRLPAMEPRKLLDLANLAKLSIESLVNGNASKKDYSRRQAQLMTLFEVSSDLSQSSNGFDMHALALNTLGVLFDVGCAAILLIDPTGQRLRVHSAMGELEKTILPWNAPVDHPDIEALLTPGTACRVDDSLFFGKLGFPEEVEKLYVFPLTDGDRTKGALLIVNTDLSVESQQIIKSFAVQLSVAIENNRLMEEVEQKNAELEAVQRIGLNLSSCLKHEELFQRILDEATLNTGASKGSIMLCDEEKGGLQVMAVVGSGEKIVSKLLVREEEGVAGQVFLSGKPLVVADVESDLRFARKNRSRYSTKSFISVPIAAHNKVLGVINLSDKYTGGPFSLRDLRILSVIAGYATLAIERSDYYRQNLRLKKISITDPLTNLVNRRHFQKRLAEEIERAVRRGHPLSLMMIDIDFFKEYNDANGHPAGDRALILTARALRSNMRSIDLVSRFGGEEFAAILPETKKVEALEIGERIRAEIDMICFPGEENLRNGKLTISLGVAEFPEDSQDIKSLVRKADKALYMAKNNGRNKIMAYSPQKNNSQNSSDLVEPPAVWTKVL